MLHPGIQGGNLRPGTQGHTDGHDRMRVTHSHRAEERHCRGSVDYSVKVVP